MKIPSAVFQRYASRQLPQPGCSHTGLKKQHEPLIRTWKSIADLLGISEDISRKIVFKHTRLLKKTKDDLEKSVFFFKSASISTEDILANPEILLLDLNVIEQRYSCLQECEISPIRIPEILRFRTLMKKTPMEIKKLKLFVAGENPPQQMLTCTSPNNVLTSKLLSNMDNMPLGFIREFLLRKLLSDNLQCSSSEVQKLFQKHSLLRMKTMSQILQNVNFLLHDVKATSSQILSYGSLLLVDPDNGWKIIHKLSESGLQAMELIRKVPLLLTQSYENVCECCQILKKYGVTNAQVQNCGNVYLMEASVLEKRLSQAVKIQKFVENVGNLDLLENLFSKRRLRQRSTDEDLNANPALASCQAKKPSQQSLLETALRNIAKQLTCTETKIENSLKRYPDIKKSHVLNCHDVIKYFLDYGFTSEQILNGLHVVLLPKQTIELHYKDFEAYVAPTIIENWKSHPYILQIFLYKLWKDYPDIFAKRVSPSPTSN